MPTLLYVGGYGRSGSTLLDIVLGGHRQICSLGEVGYLWDELQADNATCSCGEVLHRCPHWGPILSGLNLDAAPDAIARASWRAEHWIVGLAGSPRRMKERYRRAHKALFAAAASSSGREVLVDSSKTAYRFAWRAPSLQRALPWDVKMIHLVRSPHRVLASCLKGKNTRLLQGDRNNRLFEVPITLVGWLLANLIAVRAGRRLGGSGYLRVDFDELCADPAGSLAIIGRFLDLDLGDVSDRILEQQPFHPGHLVAGNRMARQPSVQVLREDSQNRVPLTALQHRLTSLICGGLYRRLSAGSQ